MDEGKQVQDILAGAEVGASHLRPSNTAFDFILP